MKRRFSPFSLAFLLYFLLAIAGLSCFLPRLTVSTDFTSLLPSNGVPEGMAEAEKLLAQRQNSRVSIYVAHESFQDAKAAALSIQESIRDMFLPEEVFDFKALYELYRIHRYQLLGEEEIEELERDPAFFQQEALARAFSPFSLLPLDNLPDDPFLIDELQAQRLLAEYSWLLESRFLPNEGVRARKEDGKWYVAIQGSLTPENLDFLDTKGGVARIFASGRKAEEDFPGLSVYYSGLAFHSYESAAEAQRETAIIAAVSIILILILFATLLRSFHVLLLFFASTGFSLLTAFSALTAFFPEIHIFTLVFGTTLIGTSIDYAIHFYLAYARELDGGRVREGLKGNLTASFLSTALCYLLLMFAPYDLLHQVSVFSLAGLLGSYLAALGLFPLVLSRRMVSAKALAWRLPRLKPRRSFLIPLLLVSLLLLFSQLGSLEVRNDISGLYKMSARLSEGEGKARELSAFSSIAYSIIEGRDEDEARRREEEYLRDLGKLKAEGAFKACFAVGSFLPTAERQHRSFEAARGLEDLWESQLALLGLEEAECQIGEEPSPLAVEDLAGLGGLVPGEIGGRYYMAVFLLDVKDASAVRSLDRQGIRYFQKSVDVNRQLDDLTRMSLLLFSSACLLLFAVLVLIYRKRGLRIASSPLIILSLTLALSPALGLAVDFFFTVALILVLGLGLDYMVFASQEGRKPMLALSLSYLTTALSFGSLSFSSFRPVHIFGLTVLTGITAAFITALASGAGRKKG